MDTDLHFLNAARQCEIHELQQLLLTSDWVRALGELIHALQKERGLSSIVLASQGRRGQAALQAQRKISDQATLHWRQTLAQLDLGGMQGGQGARLFSHIAYVPQGLQALPDLRACISAHSLSVTASTQAYIRVIAGLLAVVFEAADGAAYPGISRLLVAMFHFMQGKEWAGQERATGAAAFGAGPSELQRQQHWLHLIESQERCFQVFAECAPAALVQDWQPSCAAGPDVTTIERLRRVGCTAAQGTALDSACSEAWFDACSRVMDGMHHLETQLAQALTQECQAQLATAQQALTHTPQPGPAPSPDANGVPAFFSDPAPSLLDARWAPPLQLSVLQVFGRSVACPMHNWTIDLCNGQAAAPDEGCTPGFAVQVHDGQVFMDATELATKAIDLLRPAPHRNGRDRRPVFAAAARHRCAPVPRHAARHALGRLGGCRLHRAPHHGL